MGAGKTTIGQALATNLGRPFVDTDKVIEAISGRSCVELVRAGQFPEDQSWMLGSYSPYFRDSVIATGGSVPMYDDLVRHFRRFGPTVTLLPTLEAQRARLSEGRIAALSLPKELAKRFEGSNPYPDEVLAAVYTEREPFYRNVEGILIEVGLREAPEETLGRVVTALEAV